jgi:hypothetical protein
MQYLGHYSTLYETVLGDVMLRGEMHLYVDKIRRIILKSILHNKFDYASSQYETITIQQSNYIQLFIALEAQDIIEKALI